ncbi:MAG TPA: SRPBCC domain-containing protein [Gaiellaceae bacterium]
MSTVSTIEPVRAFITVAVELERAWEVFTTGLPNWWPVETHSVAAADDRVPEQLVIEAYAGGEIYEVYGGVRRHWARIHIWEPPRTLAYTWRVNPDRPASEVAVTFTPVEGGTRVEVVHTGWESYGEDAAALRASYGGEGGWTLVLAGFARFAAVD